MNVGTFLEARRQIIYSVASSWGGTPPVDTQPVITLQNDYSSFTPTQSATGAITVSSTGTITLGGNVGGNSGTILYQGSSSVSNCIAGACNFACGLRAYFQFSANEDNSSGSTTIGDGFTFAVLSALNNARNCSGGAPSGVNMGELMGYAGSGTSNGLGLQPPKMAIEFDFYSNAGTETSNGCSSGRNDSANNHMALMFWGLNLTGNCATGSTASGYPQASFDDNIHGAGDGTINNPYNSATSGNGSGLGGYYEGTKSLTTSNCKSAPTTTCNWMEDGHTYSFRLEISKATAGDGSGNGLYQINGWIYRDSDTIPTSFTDVTNPFTASLPQINRPVTLNPTLHAALQQIYFGFTEATGSASENVQISNLGVFFPQIVGGTCTSACTYAITPTSVSLTPSAYTNQTVAVTAATGCPWTAMSDSTTWLTVTGGASGTSFGTVTYNVTANAGAARTGHITIGSQTFTVTQAAVPTCTLTAGANIVPYNGTDSLTWSVSNGPATTATWTTSPGGTCGSPNPAGGSCTTAAQTTAGARTYTLTVSNTNGSSSCSTTFYVGCQNYSVYNNTGSRLYFKTGATCARINSGNQITAALASGGTVTRYSATDTTCSTALGSITYTAAMNVDIVANGGDGDCSVNYGNGAVNDIVTDR